jgi:hypothetical protein
MSISPLDSPVSFEYAVSNDDSPHNRYRFVRTSPMKGGSLEVTITTGLFVVNVCRDLKFWQD